MRLDPRLAAVPVVALVVAVTWVAAVVAPTPHGSAASLSSVIAVRDANLVCPQAGGAGTGPVAGGALGSGAASPGAARIAYADAGTTGFCRFAVGDAGTWGGCIGGAGCYPAWSRLGR